MRNLTRHLLAAFFSSATAAFAAEGAAESGMSPLVVAFIAFFALILAFQSIPALMMLTSVLRDLFTQAAHRGNAPGETKKSV